MEEAVKIRPAVPEEADLLTELTLRSKAYWGYDETFMAKARPVMTIRADAIRASTYQVLELTGSDRDSGRVMGFYSLEDPQSGQITLENLFIEPDAIGYGYGRALLEHALATARRMGYTSMVLDADPNAEVFYRKMGAERIGEHESTVLPGRFLPVMRFMLISPGQIAQSESEN